MVIIKSQKKKSEDNLKNIIEIKDYCISYWLHQIIVKYLGVKIHTNLVGKSMLMTFPLKLIELILSSSKEKNVLVY